MAVKPLKRLARVTGLQPAAFGATHWSQTMEEDPNGRSQLTLPERGRVARHPGMSASLPHNNRENCMRQILAILVVTLACATGLLGSLRSG